MSKGREIVYGKLLPSFSEEEHIQTVQSEALVIWIDNAIRDAVEEAQRWYPTWKKMPEPHSWIALRWPENLVAGYCIKVSARWRGGWVDLKVGRRRISYTLTRETEWMSLSSPPESEGD